MAGGAGWTSLASIRRVCITTPCIRRTLVETTAPTSFAENSSEEGGVHVQGSHIRRRKLRGVEGRAFSVFVHRRALMLPSEVG